MKHKGSLGFAGLRERARELKAQEVHVGYFESETYPDGTSVAYVATVQEFGAPEQNIPSRPFFRNAIKKNREKWAERAGIEIKAVLENSRTVKQALNRVGLVMVGDVKESIIDGSYQPLTERTLAERQRRKKTPGVATKPLVDTSQMMRTTSHKVLPRGSK